MLLILNFLRQDYPRPWSFFLEVLSLFIGLFIYYNLSKVVDLQSFAEIGEISLFEFIVLGELSLFVPTLILESFSRFIRSSMNQNTFDIFLIHSRFQLRRFWILSNAAWLRGVTSFASYLVLLFFIFDFKLSGSQLMGLSLGLLIGLPFWIGLSCVLGSLVLILQRGEGLVGELMGVVAVFSGLYFPISAFPEFWAKGIGTFSPWSLAMSWVRSPELLWSSQFLVGALYMSILGFICLGLSPLIFHSALRSYQRGRNLNLT